MTPPQPGEPHRRPYRGLLRRWALLVPAIVFGAWRLAAAQDGPHGGDMAPFLPGDGAWYVHLFVGVSLAATSVGITARVLQDIGRTDAPESRLILGAAVMDDILGLIVLAIVLGLVGAVEAGGAFELAVGPVLLIVAKAVGFLAGSLLFGRLVMTPLMRVVRLARSPAVPVVLSVAYCFLMAAVADLVGLADIVGAFAAGLVLGEEIKRFFGEQRQLYRIDQAIGPIGTIFVPVFFVHMGLRVDLLSFLSLDVIVFAGLLSVAAVVSKQACVLGVFKRGLDLEIRKGEFLTLLGPSGSGKTTCLMMLAGFETPTAGTIRIAGRAVQQVPPRRRGIGMVFQNYALFPHMTAGENLAFPLEVRGIEAGRVTQVTDEICDVDVGGETVRALPASAALLAGLAALAVPAAGCGGPRRESLTVVSWGGSYAHAIDKGYLEPFAAETGLDVRLEDYNGGLAQVRAQVGPATSIGTSSTRRRPMRSAAATRAFWSGSTARRCRRDRTAPRRWRASCPGRCSSAPRASCSIPRSMPTTPKALTASRRRRWPISSTWSAFRAGAGCGACRTRTWSSR